MDIKPIKTDADYRAALEEIEALMAAEPDSPEGEKLDVLVMPVEGYERKAWSRSCFVFSANAAFSYSFLIFYNMAIITIRFDQRFSWNT